MDWKGDVSEKTKCSLFPLRTKKRFKEKNVVISTVYSKNSHNLSNFSGLDGL